MLPEHEFLTMLKTGYEKTNERLSKELQTFKERFLQLITELTRTFPKCKIRREEFASSASIRKVVERIHDETKFTKEMLEAKHLARMQGVPSLDSSLNFSVTRSV